MREISAGIIIYRKTPEGLKFLILYHGHGYWNFPKGKIESEEKSWQAAVREVREETGLKLSDLKFKKNFKTYEKFVFWRPAKRDGEPRSAWHPAKRDGEPRLAWRRLNSKNVKVFKIVIFYLAETKKSTVLISSEHEGYGWFTYREAIKILSKYKDSQRVLKQAYEFLKTKNQY